MTDFTAPQGPTFGPPAPAAVTRPAPPARTRLRDVVFGWRAALAVLIAGIIVGGLVGAAITLIVDHSGNQSPAPSNNSFGFGSGSGFSPFGGQSGSGGSDGSDGSFGGTAS